MAAEISPGQENKEEFSEEVSNAVTPEILEKLPPEVRQQIVLMLSSYRYGMSAPNPLANKLTSEHISTLLDCSEKDSVREHKLESSKRWFSLGYVVLLVGFLVFLFIYLPTIDRELLKQVLAVLVIFAGGFGSGIGASKYKKKDG